MLAVNSYISAESGEADSKAVFSVWPSKGRPQEATAPVVHLVTQWKKITDLELEVLLCSGQSN